MHLLPKVSTFKSLISFLTVLFIFIFALSTAFAQTPGLIFKPATNGGNKILDPNGDGYASTATAGFTTTTDEGSASEITYRPFPSMVNEPLGDLTTGSPGGHTDFAPPQYAGATGSPIAVFFDGMNVMFRVRLGGQSTASKGYSVMIDTDGNFGNLVAGSNPVTTPNPGFEFEVVLASNFDVSIYNHTGLASGGTKIWSGSVSQYFQKAIAASTGSGNADYFYDFYVPLSAFPGVTADTKLRMSGVTITSAQSGIFGTVSDLGGVNFSLYGYSKQRAWADVISNFPATSLNEIRNGGFGSTLSKAPTVYSPIFTTNTIITGVSIEAEGSTIRVYQGTTQIGTATVGSGGKWSSSIPANTLVTNGVITATVSPIGKSTSPSSQAVIVKTAQSMCTTIPPIINGNNGTKGFNITTQQAGTLTIKSYTDATILQTFTVTATTTFTANYDFGNGARNVDSGKYYAYLIPAEGCQSENSNDICFVAGNGNNGEYSTIATPPIINNTTLTDAASTILNGVATDAGATISVYKNGGVLANVTASTSANSSGTYNWTYTISGLAEGDIVYAKTTKSSGNTTCDNLISGRSNILKVSSSTSPSVTNAPTITGSYCGATITTVSGTSSELAGTQIQLFANGTAVGSAGTVNAYGTWTITGLSISAGTSITAKATAAGKTVSAASNSVTSTAQTSNSGLSIAGPIQEYSSSISGFTSAPSGSTIKLYVAGSYTGNSVVVSGSVWSISGISYFDMFAGASVYVTVTTGSQCESAPSAELIVQCKTADVSFVPSTAATPICYGSTAMVNLNLSESGTVYNLFIDDIPTGTSVLGTGGAIKLYTGSMYETTSQLQVKALRVGADCPANIGSALTVNVYEAVPNAFDLSATTTTSSCPNAVTDITLTNAIVGYTYQLIKVIDAETKELIGSPVVPTSAGNITFTGIIVPATSTYSVQINRTSTDCAAENVNTKYVSVTITGGADVMRAVTISSNRVCVGESCNISIATQTGFTYKVFLKGTTTQVGGLISGDGNTRSVNTPALHTIGTNTYTVEVTSLDGVCPPTNMATEVSVQVTDGTTVPISAGKNQTICGSTSATMAASDPAPGIGTWSVVSKPTSAADPSFSDINNRFAVVSGLVTGTYKFRWSIVTCGTSKTSDVTITINCPATFSMASAKYYDEYINGEIMATASDTDNGVVSASLLSGTLPEGTTVDSGTGNIIVTDRSLLQGGNYYFTVRTTDAFGISTDSPLAIQIYDANVAPTSLSTLPVELVYFTVIVDKAKVTLQWLTASESNNDKFVVERSSNGKDYAAIGTVKGAGNSSTATKYSFSDNAPLSGTAYYRLKQVDFDGKHAFSKVLPVTANGVSAKLQVQAYPNPFTSYLTVSVTAPESETVQLRILDLQGRTVLTKPIDIEKGLNQLEFATENLTQGMYILTISGNGIDQKVKVLKAL